MTRRAVLVVVAATVVLPLLASCRQGVGEGEARLTAATGAVVLAAEEDRRLELVHGRTTLHRGARVKVTGGTARLELPGMTEAELREGSELSLASDLTLDAGPLLVVSPRTAVVEAAGTRISVNGAARLSRDLAVSAANYRGQLQVESAGRQLAVPFLRQASVASLGVLPDLPQPLRYRADDSWDRRFLGPAMDLSEELQARSRGLSASLPASEGRTPEFYRVLLPGLAREPDFAPPLLRDLRPPGETLVGAAITLAGSQGTFASRWSSVFTFRQQGAEWGLVALDQGITEGSGLIRSLDGAIGQAPLAFNAPTPAPPVARPATRGGTSARQAPAGSGSTTGSTGGTGSGSTAAAPTPRGLLPRPPSTPAGPLVTPLVDVINGLLP